LLPDLPLLLYEYIGHAAQEEQFLVINANEEENGRSKCQARFTVVPSLYLCPHIEFH
jgi:hypothetical protein